MKIGSENFLTQLSLRENTCRKIGLTMDYGVIAASLEGGLGAIQLGMIEHRSTLSVSSRIGTFARFSANYSALGTSVKFLGRVGIVGAIAGTAIDYNKMKSGEIGKARLAYRTIGNYGSLIGGMVIGAEFGGPWGAVAGGTISAGAWSAEKTYDGYLYWQEQMATFLTRYENAMRNGWVPTGR